MTSYPKPPSHQTFNYENVCISSDFDSGNCSNTQKLGPNSFAIWIGTDHPKNNYRTWFHFSISGIQANTLVTFKIKNMQNQSKLLNQGLVPVWRDQGTEKQFGQMKWQRISHKINLNKIQFIQKRMQWSFQHQFRSNNKHYFAFFYPWSNEDNTQFLKGIQSKVVNDSQIYFHKSTIIKSLEGRPVDFIVISSNKGKTNKLQSFNDQNLFRENSKLPNIFTPEKQAIILSARVHPGQVPGSHVMTGIIKQLTNNTQTAQILRDNFVFYIFPILNPDGVGRGHYRVDTNGINLNRCYLNPNPKSQPSIYAVKKIVTHLNSNKNFFAYLDLHAHASRRGTFIYGNCSNQLIKQMKTCLFPKLLSLNSADFEYEGSNFTEKNMYSKDRGDHISKEGAGRVAIYKATKNPYCWTLECNYNISRINNILIDKKTPQQKITELDQNNLNRQLIRQYWQPAQKPASQFFTIDTFHKLGAQICETFLDLVEKNPNSRIQNKNNHFGSVKYVKMNLAMALLKMAPNRFQNMFKKIYYGVTNSQNQEIISNSVKALYYSVVLECNIRDINGFIKTGDMKEIIFSTKLKSQCKMKSKSLAKNNIRYRTVLQNKKCTLLKEKEHNFESKYDPQDIDKNNQHFEVLQTSNASSQINNKFKQEIGLQSLNLIHQQIKQKYREDLISFQLAHQKQQIKQMNQFIKQKNKPSNEGYIKKDQEQKISVVKIGEYKMIDMHKMSYNQPLKSFAKIKSRLNYQNCRISQPQNFKFKEKMGQTSYSLYHKAKQRLLKATHNSQKQHNLMIDNLTTKSIDKNKIDINKEAQGIFVYGGIQKNAITKIRNGKKIDMIRSKRDNIVSAPSNSEYI